MFLENPNNKIMKTRHLFLALVTILSISILAFNNPDKALSINKSSLSNNLEGAILSMESARFDKRKADIYKSLLVYNQEAKESTAENILNAIEAFDLDATEQMYNYSLYQILYESRGIHLEDGKLLASSANALGIGQIKSVTGFHYLKQVMDATDLAMLDSLGATHISFDSSDKVRKAINDDGKTLWITPSKTKKKVKKWMKNEKNATLLWGFIMNHNTRKSGHINALVMYNTGRGTWLKLKKAGFNMNSHSYLRGIRKVEKVLNKKG
jgi:hypothetical protein